MVPEIILGRLRKWLEVFLRASQVIHSATFLFFPYIYARCFLIPLPVVNCILLINRSNDGEISSRTAVSESFPRPFSFGRSFDLLRGYAVIKRWRVSRFNDIGRDLCPMIEQQCKRRPLSLSLFVPRNNSRYYLRNLFSFSVSQRNWVELKPREGIYVYK